MKDRSQWRRLIGTTADRCTSGRAEVIPSCAANATAYPLTMGKTAGLKPLGTPRRTVGWLLWSVGATVVNVGAIVFAVAAYWELGELPAILSMLILATTFVTGVVLTAADATRRPMGVGLLLGAVLTAVLLLGWLALSIEALNANGVA